MQATSDTFDDFAAGSIRPLSWQLGISFDKAFDDSITIFTLDSSLLDGPDLLGVSSDNPIQYWDYYDYDDYTDRVQMIEWSREIEFPSSVTSALADFTVDNHDSYFSPNAGSPIDAYIIPKRPLRIYSGFNGENIQQFVGVTEKMPVIERASRTASFHALDFLSLLYTMPINQTIAMQDVKTDEVLAALFEQFGLTPDQYDLAWSSNKIPFLFYEKGTLAGEVLRKLMEAEMGNLWLDEQGIIRLQPRSVVGEAVNYTFDESNIVDIRTSSDDDIINKVIIHSDIREVQAYQLIYSKPETDSDLFVITAGASRDYEADLQDPCLTVVDPVFGFANAVSWFTANLPDGTEVTSGINVTATELRTNTFVITLQNTNDFDVNINALELWGEPAKIVDKIQYTDFNQASMDKYDEKVLEINNNFIQSIDQCEGLSFMILADFAEHSSRIDMEVKGHPGLQLGDVLSVDTESYDGIYKIIKSQNRLQSGKYTQTLTARRHTLRDYFILDQSLLDSAAVLAG